MFYNPCLAYIGATLGRGLLTRTGWPGPRPRSRSWTWPTLGGFRSRRSHFFTANRGFTSLCSSRSLRFNCWGSSSGWFLFRLPLGQNYLTLVYQTGSGHYFNDTAN